MEDLVTSLTDARAPVRSGPSPVGPLTVELKGVTRSFGESLALADLDLAVPSGRITVLLGPNGAGKTTAIRMITGALRPDTGSVRVFGLDPDVDGEDVRLRCGVVSAKPALYDRLSGRDNLQYAAELYGLGRRADEPIRAAAGRFGIADALDQQVGGYSTGMKTRLALARSVLHDPELLLFDEPTSGLDPESSHAVLELIREMTAGGHTVVMCTHLLVEAEGLAVRIVVLDAGTDLLAGTQSELTRLYWPPNLVHIGAESPAELAELGSWAEVAAVQPLPDRPGVVEVQLTDMALLAEVVARLVGRGARLTRVEPHEPTLEDLYFAVRRDHRERLAAAGRDHEPGLAPIGSNGALPPPPARLRSRLDLEDDDR
jgi:ABC-2 type transport system ATP-binding protein